MNHSAEMRRCLEQIDVNGIRKLWRAMSPHLPQPNDDQDVIKKIHYARTVSKSVGFKFRAYSHSWLTERNLPSGLPDNLKPKAERMYPRIAVAIGVATKTNTAVAVAVRGAMMDVAMNNLADGEKDHGLIRTRMLEARQKILRSA